MKSKVIKVKTLPTVPNVCNQILREVHKNQYASLAHVIVLPDETSLLHNHHGFTEWYYILTGRGRIQAGRKTYLVRDDCFIPLKPGAKHKLTNLGKQPLAHLVFSTPPFNSKDVHILEEVV